MPKQMWIYALREKEKIREIIRSHPTTRKDYFHVVVHDSGAHSLDVLVYFFLAVPD